jgi:molybdopterin adenylyltransferase
MSHLTIGILTVSDRAARGAYADESGPAIRRAMAEALPEATLGFEATVVSDEPAEIAAALRGFIQKSCDIVLTTGGTGIGPRDVTPEATRQVLEKEVPGIAEAIRAHSMRETPNAMLSRGTSGIAGGTLIVNLPGSPRAARSLAAFLAPLLPHAVEMVRGLDTHGRESTRT